MHLACILRDIYAEIFHTLKILKTKLLQVLCGVP